MKSYPQDPRTRPARGTGEVLVTGATGQVGQVLCRLLAEDKRAFRALVRPGPKRNQLEGYGAWCIDGDLRDPASLMAALDGASAILHTAGLVRVGDEALLQAVHVEGTRALVEAAQAQGCRRIVALSSDTVRRSKRDAYAESKAQAEAILSAAGSSGNIEVVQLRPPMILGPNSPHLRSLRKAANLPALPLPKGTAARAPVYVEDLARAMLRAEALPSTDLPANPIDLEGKDSLDFGALVQAVARASGQRPPTLLRLRPGWLSAPSDLAAQLGLPAPFSSERLQGMAEAIPVDLGPAQALLGWAPTPLDEALRRCFSEA